ncbi:SDR family NAD(P)-dependent oxidoreductase [Rhodopila sp.]|uniref:SDR family NAD(P)-dependent oxidoreductase n=1 Tax=Rhodopila sp. TaxID=2480087 RepID=UPI003D0B9C2E
MSLKPGMPGTAPSDPSTLGVVQWFRPGDHDLVEECVIALQALGVNRLRTHLSWADYHGESGKAWYDWLLKRLGSQFELLPCVHYTPPFLSESGRTSGPPRNLRAFADFVDAIITAHGDHFDTIELWNEPNNLLDWDWRLDPDWMKFCTMIGAAAFWARQRHKCVVLGGPCPTDTNWLRLMGRRGILNVVDAVGIHGFPGTWDSREGGTWPGEWKDVLADVRATVHAFNPSLEIWITETGYSTWRDDPAQQVGAFLKAMDAPADRIYWYGLRDLPADIPVQQGLNFDVRHYHFGLHHADGRAKLLGRLLQQGLPAVRGLASLNRSVAVVGRKSPVLITGGAGFIGSALADRLASEGENVLVYDSFARPGVEENAAWLRERHPRRIACVIGDIRDKAALAEVVRETAAVFHFAAQVAVTTSMANPADDMQVNLQGTFNLLDALRRDKQPCIFASTNKVYGAMEDLDLVCPAGAWRPADAAMYAHGCDESQSLDFRTPYGCSKGAADQYVLDFTRSFGVPTSVMRMSCIYGPRQLGTEDQGWVAHFVLRALANQPISIYGDGRQVRDILFVDDAVNAYVAAWRNIGRVSGQAFNLGGGPDNAVSLLQLIKHIGDLTGQPIDLRFAPWRPNDQRYYVSDTRKIRRAIDLPRPREWRAGLTTLVRSFTSRAKISRSASRVVA